MTLDEFLEKLDGVRPSGNGFVAICPAHDDSQPSLSIREAEDEILLNCHAGCENKDIVEALDIKFWDLNTKGKKGGNLADPEAIYEYRDESGELLYEVMRFPGKQFRQRKFVDGEVSWRLGDVRRVLYRLPQVIAAVEQGRTIYVAEGEKDVETLVRLGYEATCSAGGAGKWKPEFAEFFRGARVVIVADRDEPGRQHAETVRKSLLGIAEGVWVVQAKVGKDVTDHVEAGLPINELVPLKEGPRRGVITAASMAMAAMEDLELGPSDFPAYHPIPGLPVVFRPGRMYAVGAYTGDGKSRFALQTARWLCEQGNMRVGYFSLEMPERDLRNGFLAHKGIPLTMLESPWLFQNNALMKQAYIDAVDEMAAWELEVDYDTSAKADKVIEVTTDREYDFVIIDHLHRFGRGQDHRSIEAEVVKLTNLALELNIPVLALCQLRKYQRGNGMVTYPRPTLQDFRDTSQIGDDSSLAVAIYRSRDDSGTRFTGTTEVILLKNRHVTSREDAAGRSIFVDFDTQTQLYSVKGSGASGVHAVDAPVGGDADGSLDSDWSDDSEDEDGFSWG